MCKQGRRHEPASAFLHPPNLHGHSDAHREANSVSRAFLLSTGVQTVQETHNMAEKSQILRNDLFSQGSLSLLGHNAVLAPDAIYSQNTEISVLIYTKTPYIQI